MSRWDQLPPEVLRQMCRVDYRARFALVISAARGGVEIVVADARYAVSGAERSDEFALLVEDAWQRRGLGRRAVGALVQAARRAGLVELHSSVMRAHEATLQLLEQCGFASIRRHPDAGFVRMERHLDAAGTRAAPSGRGWQAGQHDDVADAAGAPVQGDRLVPG